MDDAAWENNLAAFRVYGPALRNSKGGENSGVDVWFKLVEKPTLKSVYQRSFDENFNYHKKNAETYDNFKVADGVGCGGTGIWLDGKLLKAGEEYTFTFEIDPARDLSFVNADGERFVEAGDYYIIVKDKKVKITLTDGKTLP